MRSSSGYIQIVDEIPAQEPAIGDTGRNASLPGFPSFGLRNAFTESYAKSCVRSIPSATKKSFNQKKLVFRRGGKHKSKGSTSIRKAHFQEGMTNKASVTKPNFQEGKNNQQMKEGKECSPDN